MKANLLLVTLFSGAALLAAGEAQAQPEGQPCEAEPTDQLLAYGDHIHPCVIGLVGDTDLFRFHGTLGEVVTVRITDQAGGGSSPWVVLELFRPDGTLLGTVNNPTTALLDIRLDRSGLFTIRVSELGNDAVMTYAAELDLLLPPSPTAVSINPGDTLVGKRIDPPGDADLFIFNGVNGDVVSLRATDQAGGGSTPWVVLELFRPDGTLATTVNNPTIAVLDRTLDQTGVFAVRVSELGNDALMTYNLEYQCLLGSCPSFHRLTVEVFGAGGVTSSPVGINCGTDCSERYFAGTVVTMTPLPSAGWTFNAWSGDADCADGIVTVTAARTCVATFAPVVVAPGQRTGDFDGDGQTDITVFRPSSGAWFVLKSSTNFSTANVHGWGTLDDIPVPGDYDGDGKTDIAVYRPSHGTWFILKSNTNYTEGIAYGWGAGGDIPVAGDYDGDGRTDIAVYRPSAGTWFILKSSTNYTGAITYGWGIGTDLPVPGDYDGDGRTDIAVYRPSAGAWFVLRSSTNYTAGIVYGWGSANDTPVPGDYDGDGKTDLAVYRSSAGTWFILKSSTSYTEGIAYGWGITTDVPVPGDYDGDGSTDIAVYRPSHGAWFILQSSTNYTAGITYQWGTSGDIPVVQK